MPTQVAYPSLEVSMAATALILFQYALLAETPSSYVAALADAQASRQPLLVLVGAEWCPGCQTMKHSVLPNMVRRGTLRGVTFVAVDADAEAELARQLMQGPSIPQLIVFSRGIDGKWHREQITGRTSEAEVQSLIARALQMQREPAIAQASAIGD
jgi:thioredoxin-like negative regulator of GroEL